jgi:hypothetical protein
MKLCSGAMWTSLAAYVAAVAKRIWVLVVALISGGLAMADRISGATIVLPSWAWTVVGVLSLTAAQFWAYHALLVASVPVVPPTQNVFNAPVLVTDPETLTKLVSPPSPPSPGCE